MKGHFFAAVALLFTASLAFAEDAGRIVFVTGDARIGKQSAALGDVVREGAEILTGADGYIYLKTVDNGFLILRPRSHARIVTYHVDAEKPENTRVKLELLNGVARAISGQAVKRARQNFRFNTPVAAIGVRGTDFTVFTDNQVSRVAVISGGVVVSGYSAACGPEGNGPCEGGASQELFAGQVGQLLQIQKGQAAPQLLRGSGVSPDQSTPPRSDEPPRSGHAEKGELAEDVSLAPKKGNEILLAGKPAPEAPPPDVPTQPPSAPTPTVPVTPPVPVPVPMPEVGGAKPSGILWGRWEAVANLAPDAEALAKLKSGGYGPARFGGPFFVARSNSAIPQLPQQGSAAFSLVNSEAYIQASGQAPVAATIQNSRLEVNFSSRQFSTDLTVVAPVAQMQIHAQGDVTSKGELFSDLLHSNATVRGYLAGSNAQEAGYVFSSNGSPTLSAFGGTQWAK